MAESPRARAQAARLSAFAGAAATAIVQRYTVVETSKQKPQHWQGLDMPLRVADDGKMAVRHGEGSPSNSTEHQVFYATADVLQSSQQALAATGSAFTIAQGGNTLIGRPPGDKRAAPQTLFNAVTSNTDLARIGRGDHTFNACSANLHNFIGVLRSRADNPQQLDRQRDVVLKLQGSLDHDNQEVVVGEDLSVAMTEARRLVTGSSTNSEGREAYERLKGSLRKQISAQYGVDEGALPAVGEGWGIIRGGKGGRDGMGHFAPVIAASGADRVTLENDVGQTEGREKQTVGEINPHWYFRMFGPVKKHWYGDEDQTFWGEARKHEKDEYGDKPLVATIGSQPR